MIIETATNARLMLYEFITKHRDEVIARARARVSNRSWPPPSASELDHGLPIFLDQLAETLKWELSATPFSATAIGSTATLHGRDLLNLGFTVSQVVHDYGDICQALTEFAMEQNERITIHEFNILNRCLDDAIAEAVTEHARITGESRAADELERLGQVAHEMRNMLNSALLAFEVVKRGTVGLNGNTGAVLGRSLTALRILVDSTLSDIRTAARHYRPERVAVASFTSDIAVAANLQAEYSKVEFTIDPIDPGLTANIDRQLLASAAMNVLNNAFKYTVAGGRVVLRARKEGENVLIEVEDQCGGIPDSDVDVFQAFGDRRGRAETGLGLGLSIARKAVKAHGGDIVVRNMPGKGCVFVIAVPLSVEEPKDPHGSSRAELSA